MWVHTCLATKNTSIVIIKLDHILSFIPNLAGFAFKIHKTHNIIVVSLLQGNGPSAMFLSLLLSGYTPFYNGSHPNPYLAAKFRERPKESLVDQMKHNVMLMLVTRVTNNSIPKYLLYMLVYHSHCYDTYTSVYALYNILFSYALSKVE